MLSNRQTFNKRAHIYVNFVHARHRDRCYNSSENTRKVFSELISSLVLSSEFCSAIVCGKKLKYFKNNSAIMFINSI